MCVLGFELGSLDFVARAFTPSALLSALLSALNIGMNVLIFWLLRGISLIPFITLWNNLVTSLHACFLSS